VSPQETFDSSVDLPDTIGDIVIVIDRAWRIVRLNRQALAVAGGAGPGLLGRDQWEAYPG
jgi:hypothetical protein